MGDFVLLICQLVQQGCVGDKQGVIQQGQLGDDQNIAPVAVAPGSHLLDLIDSCGDGIDEHRLVELHRGVYPGLNTDGLYLIAGVNGSGLIICKNGNIATTEAAGDAGSSLHDGFI